MERRPDVVSAAVGASRRPGPAARFLIDLAGRSSMLPGLDGTVLVDVDDSIVEVHGYAKQGAGFGYSGVRGLNMLLATVSTTAAAPVADPSGAAAGRLGVLRLADDRCGGPRRRAGVGDGADGPEGQGRDRHHRHGRLGRRSSTPTRSMTPSPGSGSPGASVVDGRDCGTSCIGLTLLVSGRRTILRARSETPHAHDVEGPPGHGSC